MKRVGHSPKGGGNPCEYTGHMNPQGWAPSLEALGVSPVDGKRKEQKMIRKIEHSERHKV